MYIRQLSMEEIAIKPSRSEFASAQRDNILDAASRVFTEKGFERSTTKAIAAASGLSEGALYHHFSGKRELLLGVLNRTISDIQVNTGNSQHADLYERYRDAINKRVRGSHSQMRTFFSLLSVILSDSELSEMVLEKWLTPGIEKAAAALKSGISTGHIKPVDVPAAARLIYAILIGIELLAQIGDEETAKLLKSGDRLGNTFATLLLDGLLMD